MGHKRRDARFCSEDHRKRAESARYKARNQGAIRQRDKAYRERPAVKAKRAEQRKAWKLANPEKVAASRERQNAQQRAATAKRRRSAAARQGWKTRRGEW